jgi:hypothetical protein
MAIIYSTKETIMKLNICKKFKIYTYKVKRKPTFKIFPFFRGYFENHRYIKIGVYDIVLWTKKPKKIKQVPDGASKMNDMKSEII